MSVVMVTADHHAPYLRRAVASVLAQTDSRWELLVVDDGPRGLGELVADYTQDSRVRYRPQTHLGIWGIGRSYNRALSEARGRYVAILEGDDYWPPDKLASQVPEMDGSDAPLSYGVVKHVTEDGRRIIGQAPAGPVLHDRAALTNEPPHRTIVAMARYWQFLSPASIVIRRSALDAIGGFVQPSYYPAVDYATVLKLALRGPFLYTDATRGFSTSHANSVTRKHVPGKVYLLGMFRCWLEVAREGHVRLTPRDAQQIATFWRRRLADHYVVDARHLIRCGNGPQARPRLEALLRSAAISTWRPAAKALLLRSGRWASHLFERGCAVVGRPSIDQLEVAGSCAESSELVAAVEDWIGSLADIART